MLWRHTFLAVRCQSRIFLITKYRIVFEAFYFQFIINRLFVSAWNIYLTCSIIKCVFHNWINIEKKKAKRNWIITNNSAWIKDFRIDWKIKGVQLLLWQIQNKKWFIWMSLGFLTIFLSNKKSGNLSVINNVLSYRNWMKIVVNDILINNHSFTWVCYSMKYDMTWGNCILKLWITIWYD